MGHVRSSCTAADKMRRSSLCAGANFGAAHESDVQRSPEESITDSCVRSTCTAADKMMSSLCAGANFGAAHESDVQRSPEESMTDRRNHSPHRYPNQPAGPQTNQQPASATNGNKKLKPRKRMQNGSQYQVQEPESSDK